MQLSTIVAVLASVVAVNAVPQVISQISDGQLQAPAITATTVVSGSIPVSVPASSPVYPTSMFSSGIPPVASSVPAVVPSVSAPPAVPSVSAPPAGPSSPVVTGPPVVGSSTGVFTNSTVVSTATSTRVTTAPVSGSSSVSPSAPGGTGAAAVNMASFGALAVAVVGVALV